MVCARRYGMIFQFPYVIIIMLILQINLITLDEEQCCFEFINFESGAQFLKTACLDQL